ncbi:MAG: hypothetical protein JWM19_4859 [Actinomycetia bacterium]|nr:hypothetical protein [Actinomycetes bacterium]
MTPPSPKGHPVIHRRRQYRLTRDLPKDAPGNCFPRDLKAGDLLYQCTAAYAAGLADGDSGVMLTDSPDGGYPGYEVPLSAVEAVTP